QDQPPGANTRNGRIKGAAMAHAANGEHATGNGNAVVGGAACGFVDHQKSAGTGWGWAQAD
ncbi:MAG: hypothetical protein EBR69_06820, partial [Synechococcaceae bacterium WB4_2_0805]|nr:hypothetical protein [Synechococcaceae bacterium WB4_2_0805]